MNRPMPVLPTGNESTPTTFTTAFPFVAQTNDFDDVFACAAMLSGKKIEEVRGIAVAKTKHPARGRISWTNNASSHCSSGLDS